MMLKEESKRKKGHNTAAYKITPSYAVMSREQNIHISRNQTNRFGNVKVEIRGISLTTSLWHDDFKGFIHKSF